jgi:hypothetical protein
VLTNEPNAKNNKKFKNLKNKCPQRFVIWHHYCLYIVGKEFDGSPNKKGEQNE